MPANEDDMCMFKNMPHRGKFIKTSILDNNYIGSQGSVEVDYS